MSYHFNKHNALDFGLSEIEGKPLCFDALDHSTWVKTELYDFGWGDEIGYETARAFF